MSLLLLFYVTFVQGFYQDTGLYVPKYYKFLDNQARLVDDLFKDYDATISPIYLQVNTSMPLGYDPLAPKRFNYTVFLYYLKLVEVNEPQEKVSVVMEIMEYWHDPRLAWNSSNYGGMDAIVTRQERVWSPTFSVFGVNDIIDYRDSDFRLVCIDKNGKIYDYVPLRISTNCGLDVDMFPFDTQTCRVEFCMPLFNTKEIELFNEVYSGIVQKDMYKTMGNSEWTILNLTNRVATLSYNDNFGTLQLATFEITMRRNPMYYMYMIVFPSYVINFLSIIGVFISGADKMSRLNVGLTNIMTMTFILGVMADKIPKSGTIPLLGIYIIVNLSIMIVAITAAILLERLRNWMIPKLKTKPSRIRQKLEFFVGNSLEYTVATLLIIATSANFFMMIGLWISES